MNSVKMPGFSGEASIYRSTRQYRMTGTYNDLTAGRGVVPQLPIGFCMADCDFTEHDPLSNMACKFGCMGGDGGGGGSGPSGPVCKPSCTPCQRVAGMPGRWRTCINRNCEDREVRCK